MLRVGLSGGIGSGKSTVARRLTERGAVVVDADVVAREVVEPGSEGLRELVSRFGPEILDSEGALDRPAMARRVFGDDAARAELNSVVHPRIGERTAELMGRAPSDAVLVHDIPLLVEAGYAADYHLAVIVDAPEPVRVRRLVARGLEESDARARIEAQASQQQRRVAADVWLDNGGEVDAVLAEVDALWKDRLVEFESNVRSRRPAERACEVVAHDPEWAAQADRLRARVEKAAGACALRVDHVGATAVPELAAEDVIDLQVIARSPADADALTEPLGDAGFPVLPGIRADALRAADSAAEDKRVHASADPGRTAVVHVRVAGTEGSRRSLLLRDWLRADAEARQECAAVTGEMHPARDRGDRAEFDPSWLERALPRAEQWATTSGWTPPV